MIRVKSSRSVRALRFFFLSSDLPDQHELRAGRRGLVLVPVIVQKSDRNLKLKEDQRSWVCSNTACLPRELFSP